MHTIHDVIIWIFWSSNLFYIGLISAKYCNYIQQDCIPVGCIPPARWPYLPACSATGEGGLPGPRGVPAWSGGGVVSQHALRQTPPEQNSWHTLLTRMHSSRMHTTRTLPGGCLPEGGLSGWGLPEGGLPGRLSEGGRGVYHVTYPIMHLMLPVCCLLTNWDSTPVQLLIYCWPIACWDTPPPPCGQTDACKLITLPETSFAGGKNITLPQTSFAGGNNEVQHRMLLLTSTIERFHFGRHF